MSTPTHGQNSTCSSISGPRSGTHRTWGLALLVSASLTLSACAGSPESGTAVSAISSADRVAQARQTVVEFVQAQRRAGRFVPSTQLLTNGDGVLVFQNINEDFTSGQIGIISSTFDQNDWLRLNNDGSCTIHFVDHNAFAVYIDLATGAFESGDGANLVMDFSGAVLNWNGHYYVNFLQPFSRYNFHGTGRVQPDGGGSLSTMVLHSSMEHQRLNEFVRLQ